MTVLLDQALSRLRTLPPAEQDSFAEVLLSALNPFAPVAALDDETRHAIQEGVAQAEKGEFASESEIADLWSRHGS